MEMHFSESFLQKKQIFERNEQYIEYTKQRIKAIIDSICAKLDILERRFLGLKQAQL